MQYAIIGAGGTGGVMGYFMTKAGKDVTLIARGRHLEAMKEHGLTLERLWDPNPETIAVKATDMEHYEEQPDVILVCVKGYSLEDTVPFIRRVAKPDTIVIPILNIYGPGAKLQKELPELLVTDGCIYVSANIKEPGVLVQHGKILRIVFGVREKTDWRPELEQIRQDFIDSAIDGILSENIRREALEKFCNALKNGNSEVVEQSLNNYLKRTISIRDTFVKKQMKENFYHGILLGILGFQQNWSVSSNKESGDGYSDILIETEDQETGIIIEIKYAETGNLEAVSEDALKQIEDRRYEEQLLEEGVEHILKYGIAFYKKKCKVIVVK